MKGVLSLGLLCSLVSACLAVGSEAQDVSAIGDVRESGVVSSLLPESQSSAYLLAFPVDDTSSNDNSEEVHAGGGGTTETETVTEDPAPAEKEAKEEVMTVMISASEPKENEKNDVVVPAQDLQPKEESKFFPPSPSSPSPFIPFGSKPTYRERKFPFPPPFRKLRPTFLPPMRDFLQSLRKEPQTNKISPVSILSAASLFRRALSSKLRMLNDIYQPPKFDKIAFSPPSVSLHESPEPLPSPRHPPMSTFMPLTQPPESAFIRRAFPPRRLPMFEGPPFILPPLPLHSSLLLPPVMHPSPIAPTPFVLPPPPPVIYAISPRRVFHLPPPIPMYDPPVFPSYRLPSSVLRSAMSLYGSPLFPSQRPSSLRFPFTANDQHSFSSEHISPPSKLQSPSPVYDRPPFPPHRLSSPPLISAMFVDDRLPLHSQHLSPPPFTSAVFLDDQPPFPPQRLSSPPVTSAMFVDDRSPLPPQRLSSPPLTSAMFLDDLPPFPSQRLSSPPLTSAMFVDDLPPPFPSQRLSSPPPISAMFVDNQPPPSSQRLSSPPLISAMINPSSFRTHHHSHPPQFVQDRPQEIVHPEEPLDVPSSEEPYMLRNLQETHPAASQKGSKEEELVFIPSSRETTNSDEPSYFLLYGNDSEMPKNEMTSKKKTILDLLPPRTGKVHRVIHQTRIITHYKPDVTEISSNRLEPSPSLFHKPIFRIMDV